MTACVAVLEPRLCSVILSVSCCVHCVVLQSPGSDTPSVDPTERALMVFAAVLFGSRRLPAPPDVPFQRIQQACYESHGDASIGSSVAAPSTASRAKTPPPSKKKGGAGSASKKTGKAGGEGKDRQRQLVVSHSVLIGLSQNVVNLADDEDMAAGSTDAAGVNGDGGNLTRLPARLLVERYFLLLLNSLGTVLRGPPESTRHKLRALRCLEVRV